jgi:hypothetical protein
MTFRSHVYSLNRPFGLFISVGGLAFIKMIIEGSANNETARLQHDYVAEGCYEWDLKSLSRYSPIP